MKAGDLVQLMSGGVVMTVAYINDEATEAQCRWSDGKSQFADTFQVAALKVVDPNSNRPRTRTSTQRLSPEERRRGRRFGKNFVW